MTISDTLCSYLNIFYKINVVYILVHQEVNRDLPINKQWKSYLTKRDTTQRKGMGCKGQHGPYHMVLCQQMEWKQVKISM